MRLQIQHRTTHLTYHRSWRIPSRTCSRQLSRYVCRYIDEVLHITCRKIRIWQKNNVNYSFCKAYWKKFMMFSVFSVYWWRWHRKWTGISYTRDNNRYISRPVTISAICHTLGVTKLSAIEWRTSHHKTYLHGKSDVWLTVQRNSVWIRKTN